MKPLCMKTVLLSDGGDSINFDTGVLNLHFYQAEDGVLYEWDY